MTPSAGKRQAYLEVEKRLAAVLEDGPGLVSAMASAAALLKSGLEHVFWVGFYLPAGDGALVVGPYQGPLACSMIPPGRGICGAAAQARRTIVVDDVAGRRDHIACDSRAKSEVVVPLLRDGRLLGVLDVDSEGLAAFDEIDRSDLEAVAALLASRSG